jgi:FkbM family methyltransferase
MLLDKIATDVNKKRLAIEKLQRSKLPLVIYGAGSYASYLMKFLDRYGIKVDAACVDTEYIDKGLFLHERLQVTPIEDICKKYGNFNVLIGFSDYRKAQMKLSNIQGIAEIFFIDTTDKLDFFDYQYIVDNLENFEFTYNLLGDQLSKDTFIAFINAKVSGQPDGLYDLMDKNPYFTDILSFGLNEVFVDCGAYDGDTILEFVKRTDGKYDKIYAFEPDEKNNKALTQTIAHNRINHVRLYQMGCWHSKAILRFSSSANMNSHISDMGEATVDVEAIDNIVDQEGVTFIKMDIQGSELAALHGAENTIRKSKPKLAICIYHKPEDLITIPQYIYSVMPDYKLYLRNHQFISKETVLYAIPHIRSK